MLKSKNIFFVQVSLGCALLFFAGCQHTQQGKATSTQSNSMLKIANSMEAEGNYKTAYNFYTQALESNPKNLQAHLGLIKMTRKNGNHKEALRQAQVAFAHFPEHKDLQGENVKTYLAMNEPRTALIRAKALLKKYPNDAAILSLTGVCEDALLNHKGAQKCYRKALKNKPIDRKIKGNLGLSLALSGNLKESLSLLKEVDADPFSTVRDKDNLALAYALSGDMTRAQTLLSSHLSKEDVLETLAYFASVRSNVKVQRY